MKLLEYLLMGRDDRNQATRSVDRSHDKRLDALEAENDLLRKMLNRHGEVLEEVLRALTERGIVGDFGHASAAEHMLSKGALSASAAGAKFACSQCGSLLPESELARVGGKFLCETCNVTVEPDPISQGRYR